MTVPCVEIVKLMSLSFCLNLLDEHQKKLDNLSSFNETLLEDKSKLKADLESAKTHLNDADVRNHCSHLRVS